MEKKIVTDICSPLPLAKKKVSGPGRQAALLETNANRETGMTLIKVSQVEYLLPVRG